MTLTSELRGQLSNNIFSTRERYWKKSGNLKRNVARNLFTSTSSWAYYINSSISRTESNWFLSALRAWINATTTSIISLIETPTFPKSLLKTSDSSFVLRVSIFSPLQRLQTFLLVDRSAYFDRCKGSALWAVSIFSVLTQVFRFTKYEPILYNTKNEAYYCRKMDGQNVF